MLNKCLTADGMTSIVTNVLVVTDFNFIVSIVDSLVYMTALDKCLSCEICTLHFTVWDFSGADL